MKPVMERLAQIDRQLERLRVAPAGGGGDGGTTPEGAVPNTRVLTAGLGLIGGGTLTADLTFNVGAGEGITVNADDVALAPGLAGTGLTYSAGVLNVGVSGLGLGSSADAVTLTSSSNPGATPAILATSPAGALTLYNGFFTQGAQSTAVFASGFAGSGWRADYDITTDNRASLECDDLTVRGRLRVYELLIQQIRATNGSVIVSSSSKVVEVTAFDNPNWLVNGTQLTFNGANATFMTSLYAIRTAKTPDPGNDVAGDVDNSLYHGFLYGDIIRAQQVQWNGDDFAGVILSNLEVTSVTDLVTYGAVMVNGDPPAIGYDYVRLGSVTDSSRRGVVYLTSDDSAAPFIDIVDGVQYHTDWNSADVHRVRVGKLTGISDAAFGGPLEGYGLYGNNVYLKGKIVVTGGNVATSDDIAVGMAGKIDTGGAALDVNTNTTTIDGGRITTHSITADQIEALTITADEIAAGAITTSKLNFTPVTSSNVIASINASTEFGLTINGSKLTINSSTTFGVGYDPTGKIPTGGAAADVNNPANITTINGGKITSLSIDTLQIKVGAVIADRISVAFLSAISANMGTLTAGSLVIGSTNRLWLNDAGDGALNIGPFNGTTLVKSNAPFRVTSAGILTATGVTVSGTLNAAGGGVISGNWYVGYDVNYAGSMYFGQAGAARVGFNGLSLVLADINTAVEGPNIPTRSSAIRWFPNISEGYVHNGTNDYSGTVAYRDFNYHVVDNTITAFVGSTRHTTYAARCTLQAGNWDGGTYRSTELRVIKDLGANTTGNIYCAATYTTIDGMLQIVRKAPAAMVEDQPHIFVTPGSNFVLGFWNGTTYHFKYINMNDSNTTWVHSNSVPA